MPKGLNFVILWWKMTKSIVSQKLLKRVVIRVPLRILRWIGCTVKALYKHQGV